MSAVPVDHTEQKQDHRPDDAGDDHTGTGGKDETTVVADPVVVRRHAAVAALLGYAASAVAIAFLWRASQTMTVTDWAICGAMAVIAGVYLTSLVDARTPLLVADDLGVRIRLGNEWRGLPWEAIGQVVVHPRRGLLRDGRLVFAPRSLGRALEGLDVKARRHVALNQRMYGAPLAVPLGTTTRVTAMGRPISVDSAPGEGGLADDMAALALGRSDVVVLDPATLEVVAGGAVADQHGDDDRSGAEDERAEPVVGRDRDTEPALRGRTWFRRSDHGEARDRSGDDHPEAGPAGAQADVAADTEPSSAGAVETPVESTPRSRQVVFPAAGVEIAWRQAEAPAAPAETQPGPAPGQERSSRPLRRSMLGGIGAILSRVAKGRAHDVDAGADAPQVDSPAGQPDSATAEDSTTPVSSPESPSRTPARADGVESSTDLTDEEQAPSSPAPAKPPFVTAPLRETRPGLRAEATLDTAPVDGSAALNPSASETEETTTLPDGRELRRPGSVDLVFERVGVEDRVRPISTLGDAVDPLVIDDFVTEPAYDPVIGPALAAARTRLGLSVDDLAERTRIRPHVIESIEVDDFAPCGGDFYARGHLRTLARILGVNVDPLLEKFEERYATAPINARRVFEAELATGMTGSMRSTMGGPSWGLLVGVVLSLVLVWGVLRLFTTEPSGMHAPVINGSAPVVVGGPVVPGSS